MKNDLAIIVEESGLDKTKAQVLLDNFKDYFDIASEWEVKAKNIVVKDAGQTADMEMARVGRLFLREKRIKIEKTRKQLKEQSLREGKAIDGIANVLKALIVPIEQYLEKQEKFVEIKAAEIAEQARVDMEEKAERDRIAKEKADKKEQERIRVENERLKKEAIAKEKKMQAERKKAEVEKKKLEEKARLERDIVEAERVAQEEKARKEKAEIERKARVEKEKQEKILANQKAKAQKEKMEFERLARIEKTKQEKIIVEQKRKAETERIAKLKVEAQAGLDRELAKKEKDRQEKIIADQKANRKKEREESQAKLKAFAQRIQVDEKKERERIQARLDEQIECPFCHKTFSLKNKFELCIYCNSTDIERGKDGFWFCNYCGEIWAD